MPAGGVRAPGAVVADLEEARPAWDALGPPRSFYLDGAWMAAMSSTVSDRPRVVLATGSGGRPLAGFPVHVQTASSYGLYDPWKAAGGGHEPDWAAPLRPVLTSVAPGFEGGVRWAAGVDADPAAAAAALGDALDAADALAADAGAAATAFLYVPEGEDPVLEAVLARRGWLAATVAADARLAVDWATFDDYVASRPKQRRATVRGETRRFREAGFEVEAGGVELLTDDLAPLHAAWRGRHGPAPDPEDLRALYAAVRAAVGPAMRMFVARLDGRPVAFSQFYEHGGVLYSRALGFDYGAVEGAFAYFNMIFYEPVRWAVAAGVSEVRYSMGSTDAKVARGCRLVPLRLHARLLDEGSPAGATFADALAAVDRAVREELR